jgi:hypothetical protein
MTDQLIRKLLEESALVVVMGTVMYFLYKFAKEQVAYNREQDKLVFDIVTKLAGLTEELKNHTKSTSDKLDRNLGEFNDGNKRVEGEIQGFHRSITDLQGSIDRFMEHIRSNRPIG